MRLPGFPATILCCLALRQEEAARGGSAAGGARGQYDVCVVDAFDGEDGIPRSLTSPGGGFLVGLSGILHPTRGVAVVNTHGGDLPPNPFAALAAAATGGRVAPRGWSENTQAGRRVRDASRAFAGALLGEGSGGEAFTLSTESQDNVRRGLSEPCPAHPPHDRLHCVWGVDA